MCFVVFCLVLITACNDSDSNKNVADVTPPKLIDVEITPDKIVSSGEFIVRVKAEDDISGVKKVVASIFSPDSENEGFDSSVSLTMVLHYNEKSKLWEGTKKIENYYESGKWIVWSISLGDNAGNDAYYHYNKDNSSHYVLRRSFREVLVSDVELTYLNVSDTNPDTTPPELINIVIVPKVIDGYGNLVAKAVVSEQETDVRYLSLRFYNSSVKEERKNTDKAILMILYRNPKTGIWEGLKQINPHTESGVWKTKYIIIRDLAGNERKYVEKPTISKRHYVYYQDGIPYKTNIGLLSFKVINTEQDKQKPKLTSIKITPDVIKGSGEVHIEAVFVDRGAGVNFASATLYSPSKQKNNTGGSPRMFVHLKLNPVTEKWEGTITFESYFEKGVWRVSRIFIKDLADNDMHYYIDEEKSTDRYVYKNSENEIIISDFNVLSVVKE
jgi:hypothetical protein